MRVVIRLSALQYSDPEIAADILQPYAQTMKEKLLLICESDMNHFGDCFQKAKAFSGQIVATLLRYFRSERVVESLIRFINSSPSKATFQPVSLNWDCLWTTLLQLLLILELFANGISVPMDVHSQLMEISRYLLDCSFAVLLSPQTGNQQVALTMQILLLSQSFSLSLTLVEYDCSTFSALFHYMLPAILSHSEYFLTPDPGREWGALGSLIISLRSFVFSQLSATEPILSRNTQTSEIIVAQNLFQKCIDAFLKELFDSVERRSDLQNRSQLLQGITRLGELLEDTLTCN